ncbi:MAG: hypothetical protein PHQ35_11500, partial [Phycisphaerae bacterium]|nr:hypothetical protein [Phycisphaerae bacterium]
MRTAEQVRAQQLKANSDSTASAVSSLPPSYIEGFKHTLDKYYRVTIGAGVTTVGGTRVSFSEDTYLRDADWLCAKNIGGLGSFYYVYLTKTKLFKVDRTAPQYSGTYYYQAHPTLGYRVIGKLWLDATDNQIKWCSSYFDAYSNQVTTAQTGYLGYADYYIDEDEDASILLQAANDYLSDAFSGGTNNILRGTYTTENTVYLDTNVVFAGEGEQSHIKVNTVGDTGISGRGASTYGIKIDNLKIENIETTWQKDKKLISINAYNSSIENCLVISCNCLLGIYIDQENCTISNIKVSGGCTSDYLSYLLYGAAEKLIIQNCHFYATAGYKILDCVGLDGNYIVFSNNQIDGMADSTRYIYRCIKVNINRYRTTISACKLINGLYGLVNSGINTQLLGNTCYNNGDDTGIANENEDNFLDEGIGTYSLLNSWQQPVDAEPSVGTLHLIPEASRSSAWVLNGGTANTFTDVDFS